MALPLVFRKPAMVLPVLDGQARELGSQALEEPDDFERPSGPRFVTAQGQNSKPILRTSARDRLNRKPFGLVHTGERDIRNHDIFAEDIHII